MESFEERLLESWENEHFSLVQVMSLRCPFPLKLYFHAIIFFESWMQKMPVSTFHNYNNSMGMAQSVQFVGMTWSA